MSMQSLLILRVVAVSYIPHAAAMRKLSPAPERKAWATSAGTSEPRLTVATMIMAAWTFGKMWMGVIVRPWTFRRSCNKNEYRAVICDNCGFVYQNPIYNKEHYHSLPCSYPKNYLWHSEKRAKYEDYTKKLCEEVIKEYKKLNILSIAREVINK